MSIARILAESLEGWAIILRQVSGETIVYADDDGLQLETIDEGLIRRMTLDDAARAGRITTSTGIYHVVPESETLAAKEEGQRRQEKLAQYQRELETLEQKIQSGAAVPVPDPPAPSQPATAAAQATVAARSHGPQGRDRSFDELYRQIIDVVSDDYRYAMAERDQTESLRREAGRFANAVLRGQFTSLEIARAEFKKYAEEFLVELTRFGSAAGLSSPAAADRGSAPAAQPVVADDDPRIMQIYGHIEPFRDQLLKVHPYNWVVAEIKSGLASGKSFGDIVRDLKAVVEDRERYVRQVITDELGQAGEAAKNVDLETINRIAFHLDASDETIRLIVRSAIEQTTTVDQPIPPAAAEPVKKAGFLRSAEDLIRERSDD